MPSLIQSVAKQSMLTPQSTAILLVCLLILGVLSKPIYYVFFHPLRRYPGPKLWAASRIPYVYSIAGGQYHSKLLDMHRRYGDIVRIAPNELSFTCPDAWNDIMGHRKRGEEEIEKETRPFASIMHSVIIANRANHARMRRVLSHGFSAQSMMEQQPLIQKYVDLLMKRLHENCHNGNKAIEMTSWFNWTTFDVIGDLVFGESFGCLASSDYHPWVARIFDQISTVAIMVEVQRFAMGNLLLRFMIPKAMRKAANMHREFTSAKVAQRRAMTTPRPDFMQSMLRTDEKLRMSDDEILDNSNLLLAAGSETTATTLSAVTYLLATHPIIYAKLAEEIRTAFTNEDEINLVSVQQLKYMTAVLDETFRIYPPVPLAIPRKTPGVKTGQTIGGQYLPPKTVVSISQWAMNHQASNFTLPDGFFPERWLGDPRFTKDAKNALQPFSFGPRNCIGRNLGYSEARLILARFVWNFDFRIDNGHVDWLKESKVYGLWLKPGLNVYLTPRQANGPGAA